MTDKQIKKLEEINTQIKYLTEQPKISYKKKDVYHCDDGPAIEYAYGGKEWWFEGAYIYSNEEVFPIPSFFEDYSADIQEVIDYHKKLNVEDKFIVLADQVPSHNINPFNNQPLTFKKILYKDGIGYIPNLPGL